MPRDCPPNRSTLTARACGSQTSYSWTLTLNPSDRICSAIMLAARPAPGVPATRGIAPRRAAINARWSVAVAEEITSAAGRPISAARTETPPGLAPALVAAGNVAGADSAMRATAVHKVRAPRPFGWVSLDMMLSAYGALLHAVKEPWPRLTAPVRRSFSRRYTADCRPADDRPATSGTSSVLLKSRLRPGGLH